LHENFIEIVPSLALLLLQSERIDAMKKLLMEFNAVARHYNDENGLIWYYTLAMDLLLDTCHSIITYEECFNFYLELVTSSHYIDKNQEAVSRFIANFWLWNIRNDMRERSERLMEGLRARFKLSTHSTINDFFTGLRVLEALMLQYLVAVKTKNTTSQSSLHGLIVQYLNILKYYVKLSKRCFHERLLLYELHFEMINQEISMNLFTTRINLLMAKSFVKKNYFTFNYIRYLKLNILRRDEIRTDYWLACNLKSSEMNLQKIIYFLLPIDLKSEIN
jgi:hypothetical protein